MGSFLDDYKQPDEGKLKEWFMKKKQKGGGYVSSCYISDIDLATFLDNPVDVGQTHITNASYSPYNGVGEVYTTDYYYGTFYDVTQNSSAVSWLNSLHLQPTQYENNTRFSIPFNDCFIGVDTSSADMFNAYLIENWDDYNNNVIMNPYYTLGSASVNDGSLKYFAWLHTFDGNNDYYGWLQFTITEIVGNLYYRGTYYLVNTSPITTLIGEKTIILEQQDDEQNGEPSLSVGSSANVVQKRIDEITLPQVPTLGVSTTGALNVYKVGLNDLTNFISEIFHITTRTPYSGGDIGDMLATGLVNVTNAITDSVNGDLTKFVVDMHIIPVVPNVTQNSVNINIGGHTTECLAKGVTSDYVDFSCGEINVGKNGGVTTYDGFLDLQARYKLYLPFIGFVDIQPSYIYNKIVKVYYRFNVIDGSCMAFVTSKLDGVNHTIIGVYSGSCCVHMPITGQNYSNIISGMLNVASSMAHGSPMGVVSGMVQATKPNITMSNNYNASTSFMGVRKPYLLIEKPTKNIATSFYKRNGGLLRATYKLKNMLNTGFTKCSNVDTSQFGNIKEYEKSKIKTLLEKGVYL